MSRGMRPDWRHGVQAIAASTTLLVVAGGLTACGDKDPEPAATVTHPVTPSATPTPTPTLAPEQIPPTPPAALTDVGADGATKDEAIQVAEYFLALHPYVWATIDLTQWQALSSPECTFCANVAASIAQQVDAGEHTTGGMSTITDSVVTEGQPGSLFLVEGLITQGTTQVLDTNGNVLSEDEYETIPFHAVILFEKGAWLVREVSFE